MKKEADSQDARNDKEIIQIMRRFFALTLVMVLLCVLCACGAQKPASDVPSDKETASSPVESGTEMHRETEPAETRTADDTSGQITPESGSAQLTSEAAQTTAPTTTESPSTWDDVISGDDTPDAPQSTNNTLYTVLAFVATGFAFIGAIVLMVIKFKK